MENRSHITFKKSLGAEMGKGKIFFTSTGFGISKSQIKKTIKRNLNILKRIAKEGEENDGKKGRSSNKCKTGG